MLAVEDVRLELRRVAPDLFRYFESAALYLDQLRGQLVVAGAEIIGKLQLARAQQVVDRQFERAPYLVDAQPVLSHEVYVVRLKCVRLRSNAYRIKLLTDETYRYMMVQRCLCGEAQLQGGPTREVVHNPATEEAHWHQHQIRFSDVATGASLRHTGVRTGTRCAEQAIDVIGVVHHACVAEHDPVLVVGEGQL